MDWLVVAQASVAMIVITMPIDPVKILFFNSTVSNQASNRVGAALKVVVYVSIILGGSVLVGRELLELLGINLGAFGAVGGLVVAGMGFEMLFNGAPSKAQGKDVEKEGPDADSGLLLPLSIPLIAGPGAITTAITLTAQGQGSETIIAGLIAVAAVGVVTFIAFVPLGGMLSRANPKTMELLTRLGGMMLATIGVQMLLGGIRTFYGF